MEAARKVAVVREAGVPAVEAGPGGRPLGVPGETMVVEARDVVAVETAVVGTESSN